MEAYFIAVAIVGAIYMLLTLGLTLHYGFTGLINFGHVGFFALGAYASALLSIAGVPLILAFVAGMALAALAAYPLGLLSLRLRGDYLAIVTLGFSEAVRLTIIEERWLTRGVHGLPDIAPLKQSLPAIVSQDFSLLLLLVAVNVAAVLLIRRLVKSPFGRLIQAIRDDEDAVRALGKDPAGFKVRVFMIGAALAGLGGAFYAHYITFISPDQMLPLLTFYIWVAMIMGGANRVAGAVLGTTVLVAFLEGSRFVRDILPGVSEVDMAAVRLGVVGLALILLMIYRPQGVLGASSR